MAGLVLRLERLREPIVQAPLAGGPSTPRLAAAVSEAGGFGFLAAGYKSADAVREDIHKLRSLVDGPFGVNLFVPPVQAAESTSGFAERLQAEAARFEVAVGEPRHDDDSYAAKLSLLETERVAVVSFTFGCPEADVVDRLRRVGCDVWITVTSVPEAIAARDVGADALVVQGFEAGGHRGYWTDAEGVEEIGLLALLRLVAAAVDLPLIAAGGIADGAAVAAVLCAGAVAAQVGSALMLTPEAGTSPVHREALARSTPTRLTRAFSGRTARGIVNRFMEDHDGSAPAAYPDVHHMTTPIRAAARQAGDSSAVNLWAGQAYSLARSETAADVVARLGVEARAAIRGVGERLDVGRP